jgi:MFS family permease
MSPTPTGWYRELNRYHWFVLIVAALGWLFDTMDQQLFTLARTPAMQELNVDAASWGPRATAIFLMGWATGGIAFGWLGDVWGRAKVMMLTILIYSIFTGLSAFSVNVYDFCLWRFLTGLGVGGEFAVGVALVAEVMPERARPFALGLLQALSAVGNITAALIGISLGQLEERGIVGQWNFMDFRMSAWRIMFLIGTLPALLAIVIRGRLKEPERWTRLSASGHVEKRGSIRELFGDPRWARRALAGLVLASSGVIGLWGIGFFSVDLTRSIFRKSFEREARAAEEADQDRDFLRLVVSSGQPLSEAALKLKDGDLLSLTPSQTDKDAGELWKAVLELSAAKRPIDRESVLGLLDTPSPDPAKKRPVGQSAAERESRALYLEGQGQGNAEEHVARIAGRSRKISGRLTLWGGVVSMLINVGAFFGIYLFSWVSHYIGRRPTFAICFVLATVVTALVFWSVSDRTVQIGNWTLFSDVLWMMPLVGFSQLTLFGGYAIYFPELFPTRLRSTGTSFCYNVGRFVAAIGPFTLGQLASGVFKDSGEPLRYACLSMCGVFLIGLLALPFAPETRGQPLPE